MSLTVDFQKHIVIHFKNIDFFCPTAFLYLTASFIPPNRTSIFCYTYSSTLSLAMSSNLTQNIQNIHYYSEKRKGRRRSIRAH